MYGFKYSICRLFFRRKRTTRVLEQKVKDKRLNRNPFFTVKSSHLDFIIDHFLFLNYVHKNFTLRTVCITYLIDI